MFFENSLAGIFKKKNGWQKRSKCWLFWGEPTKSRREIIFIPPQNIYSSPQNKLYVLKQEGK